MARLNWVKFLALVAGCIPKCCCSSLNRSLNNEKLPIFKIILEMFGKENKKCSESGD